MNLFPIRLISFFVAFSFIAIAWPSFGLAKEASEADPPSREAGASGTPIERIKTTDERVEKLKTYLASYNSPLTPYAKVFVQKADQYELDWRLVASISGVESTFGKRLPSNSYNAYGWNGGNFYFKDWEDGIDTVSKTLREKYADKWAADTPYEIAPYYAPPSKTWAGNVDYFMRKIAEGPKQKNPTLELKLTI